MMRKTLPILAALAASAFLSSPAATQRLGARTVSPQQMIAQMPATPPDEEIAALVAAADAHPLGSLENPIRVGGPEGERAYLQRLRCGDGAAPRVGGRSEGGVGAFGSIVGAYPVACGSIGVRLMFDDYHEEHVETRAPAGFTLQP
jgi:hypothetical protein